MTAAAPEPPELVLRPQALSRGFDDDEIARLHRRATLTRLQRGAYLVGTPTLSRRERHVLAVRATVAGLRVPGVVSHGSAAALHGLPLWAVPLDRVHVTRQPPAHSGRDTRLHTHAARLGPDDTAVVDGLVVTSVARTVVDLARVLPFGPALAVADGALHSGGATREELAAVLAAGAGTRGSRPARRVVDAADRRSESVGESRSRAVLIGHGLPGPDLQVEVLGADGRTYYGDFGWRGARLLGEFDGLVKYGRLRRPGETPGDAVVREKRREDAIRDVGWRVARWTWHDLDHPEALVRRLRARLAAGTDPEGR